MRHGVYENTKSDDTENKSCKVLTPYEIADIWQLAIGMVAALAFPERRVDMIHEQLDICGDGETNAHFSLLNLSFIWRHSHRTRML